MNNVAQVVPSYDEGRRLTRTHLFVGATLHWQAASVPVNIRNMSPSGALIESSDLPEPGIDVMLRRGSLQAIGQVAWRAGRRAGLAFETTIFVADWMSRLPTPHQQRIDEMVSMLKAGGAVPHVNDVAAPGSIADELALLHSDLAELGASLVGDVILVATHPEIQALDIALQRIDRMIESLRSA